GDADDGGDDGGGHAGDAAELLGEDAGDHGDGDEVGGGGAHDDEEALEEGVDVVHGGESRGRGPAGRGYQSPVSGMPPAGVSVVNRRSRSSDRRAMPSTMRVAAVSRVCSRRAAIATAS